MLLDGYADKGFGAMTRKRKVTPKIARKRNGVQNRLSPQQLVTLGVISP